MINKSGEKNNVTWFNGYLTREDREKLHGHKGAVIWLTGIIAGIYMDQPAGGAIGRDL